MSREDFVAVATRLFAVYVVLNLMLQAAVSAPMLLSEGWSSLGIFFALLCLLVLLVCVLLWIFPLTVARKLLPVMKEPRSEQSVDASIALSLGLTLIGVWVFAYALIDSVYWVALVIRSYQSARSVVDWNPEEVANMVSTAVELAVGAWLVFGNAGIKRLIHRFRYGQP